MRTLDLQLLRTFHTIVRLRRFKDAAATLNKSTSAISAQVQRLEQWVGGPLFVRDNTGVVLSARGQLLFRETASIMAEHDRVLSALFEAPVSGQIRLGVPEEYASGIIGECLPLFALRHPRLEIILEAATSERLAELYVCDSLDAVVTIERRPLEHQVRLTSIQPVWALSSGMEILRRSPLPVALHLDGCPYRTFAERALAQWGRPWIPIVSSGNSTVITKAIESGLAIGVLASTSVTTKMAEAPSDLGLPAPDQFEIVYSHRDESDVTRILVEAMRTYFQQTYSSL